MPSGDDRGGKVHRYDGVHREHQRCGDAGKHEAHFLETGPMLGASAPSETQDAVDLFLQRLGHPVADGRKVRYETDVPKDQGDGEVGRDGKHVPKQRTVEIDPERTELVWQGQHPIAHPDAAHVDAWEHGSHDHRENGHGLRRAVDGHPPLLTEEQQHCGNQRPGVTDSDPPHEVGDVPGPTYGLVEAPHTDARTDEVKDAPDAIESNDAGDGDHDFPSQGRLALDGTHDIIGDVLVALVPQDQGFPNGGFLLHGIRSWGCCGPSSGRRRSAGCRPPPRRGRSGCCHRWRSPHCWCR